MIDPEKVAAVRKYLSVEFPGLEIRDYYDSGRMAQFFEIGSGRTCCKVCPHPHRNDMKRKPLTLAVAFILIVIFVLMLFVYQVRKSEAAVIRCCDPLL